MTAKRGEHDEDELKVGDRVKVKFGSRDVDGVIVEDRGRIGVGGRRMVHVRVTLEVTGEVSFDIPAEELIPAA